MVIDPVGHLVPRVVTVFSYLSSARAIRRAVISWIGPHAGTACGRVCEVRIAVWQSPGAEVVHVLTVLLALVPLGALLGVLMARSWDGRVAGLVEASRALVSGDHSRRVRPCGRDEVAALQQQFNLLAGRLQAAADHARIAERHRIARELHDSVSQELFSLRMEVAGLEARLAHDPSLRLRLDQVGCSLSLTIRRMRALLLDLRPPITDAPDLPSALRDLAASYRLRLGLHVQLDLPARWSPLPDHVEHDLLRIAHEALANAARHSAAQHVAIALLATRGRVLLHVSDDGRGFDPSAASAGLGLLLLRERTAALRGQLRIRSAPGRGTCVSVTVAPCPPA